MQFRGAEKGKAARATGAAFPVPRTNLNSCNVRV